MRGARSKILSLVFGLCIGLLALASRVWAQAAPPQSQAESSGAQKTEAMTEPSPQQFAPARLEAKIVGPNPAYVGQMVLVEVALFRDNAQKRKSAPFFPEVKMRGAIVVRSHGAPPPTVEKMDGVEFLVQRRVYQVFAQQEGDLIVPPVSVTLVEEAGAPLQVTSKALELHADVPRGAGSPPPLIARNVNLERSVQGDLDSVRVGETVSVSLTLSAEDTDALLLPSLPLPEVEGLSRYPSESASESTSERGIYKAQRVESATYVVDRWGFLRLPPISILWLDPESGEYRHAEVPPLSFRARVNPTLGSGCLGGPAATAGFGGGLGALALFGLWLLRLARSYRKRRETRALVRRTEEEKHAFAELRAAALKGDDAQTLTALYRWLARAFPHTLTLEEFCQRLRGSEAINALHSLETRVATGAGEGRSRDILPGVERVRKSQVDPARSSRLPELNS